MLHGVHITHPDRIVFEDGSLTKGDVARYYAEVAPLLLRDIKNRPITVVRCPGGIKADCFYQRNVGVGWARMSIHFIGNIKAAATNISM